MAILWANDCLAAFSAKRAVHLHRFNPFDVALLWPFLGGPGADSFVRADGFGAFVSFSLSDAVHRCANVRLAGELAFHWRRGGIERLRDLSGPLSAVQQLGCAGLAGGTVSPGRALGPRSPGEWDVVRLPNFVRYIFVYRLRDALWTDASAAGSDEGPAFV